MRPLLFIVFNGGQETVNDRQLVGREFRIEPVDQLPITGVVHLVVLVGQGRARGVS